MIMAGRFWFACVLLIGLVAGSGCKEEDAEVINKLDPGLKLQVEQLERTMLSVILRTKAELDTSQQQTLESHGVTIQSHIGAIYVCRIPLKSILPVAREEFVVRLEAPKELKTQQPR